MKRISLMVFLALLLVGCTRPKMFNSPPTSKPQHEPYIRVGVRQVDITPPAGLSLWGHGPESRVATGRLTRLRCQIFVFIGPQASADSVALVTCDMAWSSMVLQRQVARRVHLAKVPLGAHRIWVMATHTHAGVGHLWPWGSYTGPMSSRLRGFDMDLVNYMAEKIGDAVIEAYEHPCKARVAWNYEPLYGVGYNRSLVAHRRNDDRIEAKLADGLTEAESAIDPQLALLRIDCVDEGNDGVLAVYGVHPAVIENTNELYHGDVFGFATRQAHARIRDGEGKNIVVGIANGIEGDVAPQKRAATVTEALRLGQVLGDAIYGLWKKTPKGTSDAVVRAGYRDLRMDGAQTTARALCAEPMLGASAGGGSSDNPTKLRLIMHNNPGVRRAPGLLHGCHDEKLGVQKVFGRMRAGKDFPSIVPIAMAQIGNGVIATVPGELTTAAGLRLRSSVVKLSGSSNVAIVGLTGSYIQYVATAEEYPLQLYEGASTLYGPSSATFFVDQHACLASYLFGDGSLVCGGQKIDEPYAIPYNCAESERLVCNGDEKKNREAVKCPPFKASKLQWKDNKPKRGRTEDEQPAYEVRFRRGELLGQGTVVNRPLVSVSVENESGIVASDKGSRLAVRLVNRRLDLWAAVWRPNMRTQQGCNEEHRFRIHGLDEPSEWFTLDCSDLRAAETFVSQQAEAK